MKSFKSFDGTRIAFHDEGSGPAVVLLHGYGLDGMGQFGNFEDTLPLLERNLELFREAFGKAPAVPNPPAEGRAGLMTRLLAAGARIIVPDMRGFGSSDKPVHTASYANSAMARDVLALIDHLEIRSVDVVGFSMGALTGARLLALGGRELRSAVLSGIGDYIVAGEILELPASFPVPASLPRPLTHTSWAEEGARILKRGELGPGHLGSAHLITAKATGIDRHVLAAIIRGAIAETIPRGAWHGSPVPVLLLNGQHDVANQKVTRLLEEIPVSEALQCQGDHYNSTFQPEFQEAVVRFLESHWSSGKRHEAFASQGHA